MVRSTRIQLVLISALTAGAALGQQRGAQNSDFSFLLGPVIGSTQPIAGTSAAAKVSGEHSFQYGFAHTIHSYSFADLWFEFPTMSASRESTNVGGGISKISYSEYCVTPGLRLHVPVGSRLSFYAAAGGGYGTFSTSQGGYTQSRNYHGVFEFGGGIDFRLTRLLSLRSEVRDFVTGRGLGGVDGRNHVIFGFGVAAHF